MFVQPKTPKTKTNYSSDTKIQYKDEISTNKTILFGVIALLTVAFVHIQAVDSEMATRGQFSVSAFSEEQINQSPEDRVRKHFTSDVSSIVASGSGYELLEERGVVKNHFTADTSNVISSGTDSDSSSEHDAKRLHF